jgi:hypothetical protein
MVRPYRVEDWAEIVDSYQAEFLQNSTPVTSGPAYTYELDGKPVIAGGICPYWPGVGLGWIAASPAMREHPVLMGRLAWKIFKKILPDFWRVEAVARADRPEAHTFLIRLGFKPEGLAQQYGPDRSDFVRFAWVRSKQWHRQQEQ